VYDVHAVKRQLLESLPMASRTRGSTSREAILTAALRLVDREGLEGLTMRSLAAELGVVPMAAYRHFANKGELLDALLEDVTATVDLGDGTAGWRDTARHLAASIRTTLLGHPGVVPALVNRPSLGPSAIRLTEVLYAALRRDGFAAPDLELSANLVFGYVLGFVAFEAPRLGPKGSAEAALHVSQEALARAYEGLDPGALPITSELHPDPAEFVSARQFAWGLEVVLDGLERRSDR
jgi:AcrR family transcriptional regulator